jgi:hypothetical protein
MTSPRHPDKGQNAAHAGGRGKAYRDKAHKAFHKARQRARQAAERLALKADCRAYRAVQEAAERPFDAELFNPRHAHQLVSETGVRPTLAQMENEAKASHLLQDAEPHMAVNVAMRVHPLDRHNVSHNLEVIESCTSQSDPSCEPLPTLASSSTARAKC